MTTFFSLLFSWLSLVRHWNLRGKVFFMKDLSTGGSIPLNRGDPAEELIFKVRTQRFSQRPMFSCTWLDGNWYYIRAGIPVTHLATPKKTVGKNIQLKETGVFFDWCHKKRMLKNKTPNFVNPSVHFWNIGRIQLEHIFSRSSSRGTISQGQKVCLGCSDETVEASSICREIATEKPPLSETYQILLRLSSMSPGKTPLFQ